MCKCNDCRRHPPTRLVEPSEPRIYRTIRFRFDGRPRTLRNGLTLTEAQAHCERPDTSSHSTGAGAWFDGYDYMRGCAPKVTP
jgi:hypothetical protein